MIEAKLTDGNCEIMLAVKSGRALYAGISNYRAPEARKAISILKELGTPCVIHQPKYSMFERWVEDGLLDVLEEMGVGCIPFSPLAQGMLTDKYLKGIPENSRASKTGGSLWATDITPQKLEKIKALNDIAQQRNQSLAQMAITWLMKDKRVTTVLIGASSVQQLDNNLDSLQQMDYTQEELQLIETILAR